MGEKNEADIDVELQKPDILSRDDVDTGVEQVEANQAVWGKTGKYIIIADLRMVPINVM